MTDIIKTNTLLSLSNNIEHEKFQVGDYVTDNRNTELYHLVSCETKTSSNGSYRIFSFEDINPITLEIIPRKMGNTIAEDTLQEYYHILNVDPLKMRSVAHKIVFEGAKIEDFNVTSEETSLMALNNKQTLIALRSDVEKARKAVLATEQYCNLVRNQLMNDIQSKIDGINSIVDKMSKQIDKLSYVVQSIETYAGIKEEVVTLKKGEAASEDIPIVIRQAVLFMDEEIALTDDDFDWQKISNFDSWLIENDNFKTILPDEKSIVAIKPRRTRKNYSEKKDDLYDWVMNKPNQFTLFLIRNGENLYRLESEHIELDDRLFPNVNEYQEALNKEKSENFFYAGAAANIRRTFTMVAFLLQGLLDRSTVFSPHHSKCNFLKFDGFDDNSVILRYELDKSHLLTDGRPTVWDWIKQLSAKLTEGKRIILVTNDYYGNFQGYEFSVEAFIRSYNYDYSVPSFPHSGIYTIKKNPNFDKNIKFAYIGDCYTSPYCISYLPEERETSSWQTIRRNKVNIAIHIEQNGILNYDDLNIDDLDYYLNNRLYRSQYFRFVRLLKKAKSIVEQEKKAESYFFAMLEGECLKKGLIPKEGYVTSEIIDIALQAVKDHLKWKRPISSKEKETYTLVKRKLFSSKFKDKYFISNKNEKES